MNLYLAVVNLAAFVGAAIALIRYRRNKADRDDVGRALMVSLTAILFLALGALARRAQIADVAPALAVYVELAIAAAWTSVTVAAWWTATHRAKH